MIHRCRHSDTLCNNNPWPGYFDYTFTSVQPIATKTDDESKRSSADPLGPGSGPWVVESPAAHGVVMLLIVANAVVIAVATDWVETGYLDDKGACRKLSLAVLFVFTVEIVAKLFAFHALFFRDGWNVADLLIVAVGLGFHTGVIPHGHTTAVIRLVRIQRLTRVVEVLPGLEILMRGFLTGLSSCLWVLAITMLFMRDHDALRARQDAKCGATWSAIWIRE